MNRRTVIAIVCIAGVMYAIGSNLPEPFQPTATANGFTDGTWIVGKDIRPGKYRSTGTACIWERLSSLTGGSDALLDYGDSAVPVVVTIKPTDKAFESTGCGPWVKV
jgi:hypothetical protein